MYVFSVYCLSARLSMSHTLPITIISQANSLALSRSVRSKKAEGAQDAQDAQFAKDVQGA